MATRILLTVFLAAILCTASPLRITADAPEGTPLYVVRYGDSLESIAGEFGVSAQMLRASNALTTTNLYVGQLLRVPAHAGAPAANGTYTAYIVRYGDTLSGIAWRYGVSVSTLTRLNRIYNPNFIYAGMRLLIPRVASPARTGTYTVQYGDTLSGIALRFGTTVYALMIANNIANPHLIYAGMRINVPTSATAPTAAPPTAAPRATQPSAPTPTPYLPSPTPFPPAIVMQNMSFLPNSVTIRAGTTVTWTNIDTIQHTATSGTPGAPNGLFDSGALQSGQTFSFTFTTAGTYAYFCRIHGAAMTGTITVIPPGTFFIPPTPFPFTPAPDTSARTRTPTPNIPIAAIVIQSNAFLPQSLTIKVGTLVRWINIDSVSHAIASGAPNAPTGQFNSGTLNQGQTHQFIFWNPGTYPYFCRIHGAAMTGTIIVQP